MIWPTKEEESHIQDVGQGEGDSVIKEEEDHIHDVVAFMIVNLKFLSMMLGKEDFDDYWCYL